MKIMDVGVSVEPIYYVTTDEMEFNEYRKQGDNWEVAMGESWEPVYRTEELDELFKEWQGKGIYDATSDKY